MLYLVGIIITFFLVIVLTSKKNKSEADKILALWLFFTGFHLFLFYLHFKNDYINFPFLLGLELPMPLVQGPFLFLYTSALTNQNQYKKYNVLHYIPFTIAIIVLLPFFGLPFEEKISIYQKEGEGFETLITVLYGAILLSGIIYALLSLQKLSRHKKNISNQFSFTEKINLTWLRYLILGSGIIWLVVIFFDDQYIFSVVVFYLFFIGYFGINQVGVFTNKPIIDNKDSEFLAIENASIENQSEKIKYEKSALNTDDLQSIHQKLEEMITSILFKYPIHFTVSHFFSGNEFLTSFLILFT